MREEIICALKKEVYERCCSEKNHFGFGIYAHIESVVRNASFLAKEYGADEEIVAIAAWLHDIASVTDYALYKEHHIHGADIARPILEALGYEEKRIVHVQECIYCHRGSRRMEMPSVEAVCVADADAISHFDSIPSLLYLAYVKKGMSLEEGISFVRGKLERSFAKLSDRSKEVYREKYARVMSIIGDA